MSPSTFAASLVFALGLSACLQIGPSSNTTATSTAPTDAGTSSTPSTGTGCGTDVISGVTLCSATSLCLGLVVDRDLYADCGFRVPSTSIDLECICGDYYLCSIGTALNCAQAQTLLASQSELLTCSQVGDDRCALRAPSKPATNCDHTCLSGCAGDPGCVTLCGC